MLQKEDIHTHPMYPIVKEFLLKKTGLHYYNDKDYLLIKIIEKRLIHHRETLSAYHSRLSKKNETELKNICNDLAIDETYFFRHIEIFDTLTQQLIPSLIKQNKKSKHLKIWSAGCSFGPEPYTIAIILGTIFKKELEGWTVTIIGTDVSSNSLKKAKSGLFSEWALRSMTEGQRSLYFTKEAKNYRLSPKYCKNVTFLYHNLINHPFPSLLNNLHDFDIIFCRNVTIYFSEQERINLIQKQFDSLRPNGWLIIGHAEHNITNFNLFLSHVINKNIFYQKPRQSESN
jgi:chemotaxis protein methyltransferase CheR